MNQDGQIRAKGLISDLRKIAAKVQADVNEAGMGPPGTRAKLEPRDNGASPSYPHLSKAKHTTSYVLYTSVPEEMAPEVSAALAHLTNFEGAEDPVTGIRPPGPTNLAVLDSILHHARDCGWEPE